MNNIENENETKNVDDVIVGKNIISGDVVVVEEEEEAMIVIRDKPHHQNQPSTHSCRNGNTDEYESSSSNSDCDSSVYQPNQNFIYSDDEFITPKPHSMGKDDSKENDRMEEDRMRDAFITPKPHSMGKDGSKENDRMRDDLIGTDDSILTSQSLNDSSSVSSFDYSFSSDQGHLSLLDSANQQGQLTSQPTSQPITTIQSLSSSSPPSSPVSPSSSPPLPPPISSSLPSTILSSCSLPKSPSSLSPNSKANSLFKRSNSKDQENKSKGNRSMKSAPKWAKLLKCKSNNGSHDEFNKNKNLKSQQINSEEYSDSDSLSNSFESELKLPFKNDAENDESRCHKSENENSIRDTSSPFLGNPDRKGWKV